MQHSGQTNTRNPNDVHNVVKLVECCEVGCWCKVEASSPIKCSECKRPMCRTCKTHTIKFEPARGRCDICCWNEIT